MGRAIDASLDAPGSWADGVAAAATAVVAESCGVRVRLGGPLAPCERLHGSASPSSIPLRAASANGSTVTLNIFTDLAHRTDDRKRLTLLQVAMENRLHVLDTTLARVAVEPGRPELWRALARAELTLVRERGELALVATPESSRVRRALSALESEVIAALAAGAQNKRIAANLQCSPGTISRVVSHAAAKLGVTRIEALRVHSILMGRPAVPEVRAQLLTATERDVLALVCQGLSNDAIARARQRSPRTVANQIASVLRKTRMPSRRALAAARWDA